MNVILDQLPPKEATKFKEVIKLYDEKLFKKSLKQLNTLMKKSQSQKSGMVKRIFDNAMSVELQLSQRKSRKGTNFEEVQNGKVKSFY